MSDEATSSDICPACGYFIGNRAGGKPSQPEESIDRGGDIRPDVGAGQEHGERLGGDVKWFHYIPLSEWEEWEKIGWRISGMDSPHADYSVMGIWGGDGEPTLPPGRRWPSLGASSSAAGRGKPQP